MLTVRDLRVDYDNFCAVKNVFFTIQPGQVLGLLGPNGSGKTTTMRAIMGLIEPTYGDIFVEDVDMREHPERAFQMIGFMPDFAQMYDDLLVWEFLDLFAACYYVPKAQRAEVVERYLHLVNLWDKRDSYVPGLSRGMKQRLMLAKTLIPDPQVLMLDEPASGLDPNARLDLKRVIVNLAERGKCVLVSSHILSEMNEFCNAVGIMEKGRMVVSGSVETVARAVMGAALYYVEILETQGDFRELLLRDPLVENPRRAGTDRYEFEFRGDAQAASALLRKLVQSPDMTVVGFGRKKEGLEDLFQAVGAREVS